jgi:LPS sulfotransferase NodH
MTTPIWHQQFSEELDFCERSEPIVKYVICSTPRSGSHFLGHLMYGTRALGYPLEYVSPTNIGEWIRKADEHEESDVIRYIMSRRTSPNGCFGLKAHYSHLENLYTVIGLQTLINEYKFVFLRRKNLLSQAVSLAFSEQTGSWISGMPEQMAPLYDYELINNKLIRISRDNARWERFLYGPRLPTYEIFYEDVLADPGESIRRIMTFLGTEEAYVENDETFVPKPESTSVKREWCERFSQEHRTRLLNDDPQDVKKFNIKQYLKKRIYSVVK